ncbi:Poly(rC)-binding protein 3 [Dermatophagoides pteronyssinus]|uniref:Poly(RC)-binding protein 3 n=1 Tax=Dermatophagoides pteronyssinus TaxID=6956 RepID=A0ABQ8JEW9_DERPT|nr:Poly(rC)-binding protein 3 [Dermatophagoides pteronyssinus]
MNVVQTTANEMANNNTVATTTTTTSTTNSNANATSVVAATVVGGGGVTLTIRLIMQGKEVGSIIGKKGDNIKKFREESGAKITISDGSCPERIVTVTGSTESILKAFAMIARKFEEDANNNSTMGMGTNFNISNTTMASSTTSSSTSSSSSNGKQNSISMPVTLKLIVPASQCGSLIGKGGSKIKEIREITGASIQVASEMLPNSTERAVTLSGSADSITKSIYQICCVMLESPPKGPTIPYRPKPAMPPVFFAGGQAYTIQGQFAIPHPDLHRLALQHAPLLPGQAVGSLNPQATLATLAANTTASMGHHGNTATANNPGMVATLTTEMTISNDIIGSVIGKGGSKINEIRQLSGATIKINSSEEGTKDRTITISGTPEAINLAQYLIATSSNGLLNNTGTSTTTNHHATAAAHAAAVAHASTLSTTGQTNSLSAMAAVAAAVSNNANKLYTTGNLSKHNIQSITTISNGSTSKSNKNDRKYAPY